MNPLDDWARGHQRARKVSLTVGDEVDVFVTIKGVGKTKDRVQRFTGRVIKIQGASLGRSFTVRRILNGEGIERTFPVNSPLIDRVHVHRHAKIRRAKLYYLRRRVGKAATRLRERIRRVPGSTGSAGESPTAAPGPDAPAPDGAAAAPAADEAAAARTVAEHNGA